MRTLNNETAAVLPAGLRVTRDGYVRFFARSPGHRWALYGSTFVPYDLRELLSFGRGGVRHWLEIQEHLEHGCICPAQLVDSRNGLVATFVNLNAQGERSLSALKITRAPLHLLPARLQRKDALLACASIFHATRESWDAGYWADFTPLPVHALASDEAACDAAQAKLSRLAWEALALAVPQAGQNPKEGLHRVDVPHEIVWNAF